MKKQIHNKHPTADKIFAIVAIATVLCAVALIPVSAAYHTTEPSYADGSIRNSFQPYTQLLYGAAITTDLASVYQFSTTGAYNQLLEDDGNWDGTATTHYYVDREGVKQDFVDGYAYISFDGAEILQVWHNFGNFYISDASNVWNDTDVFGDIIIFHSLEEGFYCDITYEVKDLLNISEVDEWRSEVRTGEFTLENAYYTTESYDDGDFTGYRTVIHIGTILRLMQTDADNLSLETSFVNSLTVDIGGGIINAVEYRVPMVTNYDKEDVHLYYQSMQPSIVLSGLTTYLTDVDIEEVGGFLGQAIGGFFTFEIGGINIGIIFVTIIAFLFVFAVLRAFAGG